MGVKTAVVRVILYKRTVICRIGSLEKADLLEKLLHNVICRIGSLEKPMSAPGVVRKVICRIGSLEILLKT